MKVVVLGTVVLNGGDAAIAVGQHRILQEAFPDAEFVSSDVQPEAAAKYYPADTFIPYFHHLLVRRPSETRGLSRLGKLRPLVPRFLRWRAFDAARGLTEGRSTLGWRLLGDTARSNLRTLRDADLVVYCGGTSLTENYNLEPKLFDVDLARALGRPYVYLQQSAGPFHDPHNRAVLAEQFSGATLVVLRDERSLRHVLDLGVPAERCIVLPDTVFALASEHLAGPGTQNDPPRVAVSVREWKHFSSGDPEAGMQVYVDAVRAAVTDVVRRHGAKVEFVSTCQGRPEYWTDDSLTALKIAEGLPEDVAGSVTVDRSGRTPSELIDHLATFDVMVSTRLHGAISAACAGVPTLAVAYEYKSHEVWAQLGLSRFVLDIEDLDAAALCAALDSLVVERSKVREILQREVPVMRDGALQAGRAVRDALHPDELSAAAH